MALCVHGIVCGYKHDWPPAASNKDTVAMGFVRGTAMVDFHIHGRLEKNGLYRQRPGSAGVGSGWLGHREGGEFGRFSRGAWEINKAAFKLAWPGLAWLGLVRGVGGEGAACPLPPKHTPDQIAGCDVQLLWHFVCVAGAMALCVHLRLQTRLGPRSNKDTVAMGFVRGTAMVDFHIHGRLEKKMVWAGLGSISARQ